MEEVGEIAFAAGLTDDPCLERGALTDDVERRTRPVIGESLPGAAHHVGELRGARRRCELVHAHAYQICERNHTLR